MKNEVYVSWIERRGDRSIDPHLTLSDVCVGAGGFVRAHHLKKGDILVLWRNSSRGTFVSELEYEFCIIVLSSTLIEKPGGC
jgi:hypothetical protein